MSSQTLTMTTEWDKTFPLSEQVEHEKVTFHNRFGIELAADLYRPKDDAAPFPALAVSGPFGAVKEQASGLYAQTMAERGFLTVAFDPSYTGESGGTPRRVASPDINTDDFSAAVDFLSTRDNVDPEAIGIIGICGWGGIALNAAALDPRIKATLASTLYVLTRVATKGYNDAEDSAEQRMATRRALAAQRSADYTVGTYARAGGVPDELPADAPQYLVDYHAYYKTERGFHERSGNSTDGWNTTSNLSWMNTDLLRFSDEIENAVMVLHGERAHSRYMGEDAFALLTGENKKLVIVPGASHVDLYDGGDAHAIPFDTIEQFFTTYLGGHHA
ncbi:alpha/beta hydrolase [Actinomyces trachealis]|uniref:alpha/beta hydrolase n=1 Tax=Actinomyces trachealis TaxID=2763540 RepID=UPI0018928BD7|nr:alpha/beta hydrolase [Actinomyces trachealis]